MLGCVLALALIRDEPARVTLWEPMISVGNLARRLSVGKVRVKADPSIADRLVTIYATDQPAEEFGRQTADALGLRWKKRGFHWAFEPDPAYEAMIAGHENEVRRETRLALDQLVQQLRLTPPKFPHESNASLAIKLRNPIFEDRALPLETRKEHWRDYNVQMAALQG